jgi:metal-responsive CopG/Arc/MetJ family transcriptional regulator
MKTAISIPDRVFKTAETLARRQNLSRSALFTQAVTEFIAHHRHEGVTEELNKVYEREASGVDPLIARFQSLAIPKEKW